MLIFLIFVSFFNSGCQKFSQGISLPSYRQAGYENESLLKSNVNIKYNQSSLSFCQKFFLGGAILSTILSPVLGTGVQTVTCENDMMMRRLLPHECTNGTFVKGMESGSYFEEGTSIIETPEGEIMIFGKRYVDPFHYKYDGGDYTLIKLSNQSLNRTLLKYQRYNLYNERPSKVIRTTSGEYWVIGTLGSFNTAPYLSRLDPNTYDMTFSSYLSYFFNSGDTSFGYDVQEIKSGIFQGNLLVAGRLKSPSSLKGAIYSIYNPQTNNTLCNKIVSRLGSSGERFDRIHMSPEGSNFSLWGSIKNGPIGQKDIWYVNVAANGEPLNATGMGTIYNDTFTDFLYDTSNGYSYVSGKTTFNDGGYTGILIKLNPDYSHNKSCFIGNGNGYLSKLWFNNDSLGVGFYTNYLDNKTQTIGEALLDPKDLTLKQAFISPWSDHDVLKDVLISQSGSVITTGSFDNGTLFWSQHPLNGQPCNAEPFVLNIIDASNNITITGLSFEVSSESVDVMKSPLLKVGSNYSEFYVCPLTVAPTITPTLFPSHPPTFSTYDPTPTPSINPTPYPTPMPSMQPTLYPTFQTDNPTPRNNRPQVVQPLGNFSFLSSDTSKFIDLSSIFLDADGDMLQVSVRESGTNSLPSCMSFNDGTQQMTVLPNLCQSNCYSLQCNATDPKGLSKGIRFYVKVNKDQKARTNTSGNNQSWLPYVILPTSIAALSGIACLIKKKQIKLKLQELGIIKANIPVGFDQEGYGEEGKEIEPGQNMFHKEEEVIENQVEGKDVYVRTGIELNDLILHKKATGGNLNEEYEDEKKEDNIPNETNLFYDPNLKEDGEEIETGGVVHRNENNVNENEQCSTSDDEIGDTIGVYLEGVGKRNNNKQLNPQKIKSFSSDHEDYDDEKENEDMNKDGINETKGDEKDELFKTVVDEMELQLGENISILEKCFEEKKITD